MAIALDATSSATASGSDTISWTHTCTGSDLVLVVFITGASAGVGFSGTDTMTYNGVAMTFVDVANDGVQSIGMWYLLNPATGANTVLWDWNSGNFTKSGFAVSLTGCDSTSQPDSSNKGTATSFDVTLSTTVVDTGCWLVGAIQSQTGALSAGTGATERQEQTDADSKHSALYDSNGTVGTGSQSMVVSSATSTDDSAWAIMSIAPKVDFIPQAIWF